MTVAESGHCSVTWWNVELFPGFRLPGRTLAAIRAKDFWRVGLREARVAATFLRAAFVTGVTVAETVPF